jgi:CheY-like chemotaxis protein
MPTQLYRKDPTQRKAKTVLVIEDDKVTLKVLDHMIKGAGYKVVTAADASEALKAVRLERPELVVADVTLNVEASGHEWDGFQVLGWMKYHYPEHSPQAIIISAADPEKIRRLAVAAGAFGFVGKPIVKNLLLAEIKRAIGDPFGVARHGETTFFRRRVPL